MAITTRTYDLELVVRGGPSGFIEAYGVRRKEYLDNGVVDAERDTKITLTLQQVKNQVAAL